VSSALDKTSVKHVRRRRRRSLASATSPLTAVKVDRTHEKHKLKFVKIDQVCKTHHVVSKPTFHPVLFFLRREISRLRN